LRANVIGEGALVFRQDVDSKVGCGAEVLDGGDRVADA